jgi:hypothetical protein
MDVAKESEASISSKVTAQKKEKPPKDGNIISEPSDALENEAADDYDSDDSSEGEEDKLSDGGISSVVSSRDKEKKEAIFARVRARLAKRREVAEGKKNPENLRSPVICVLGHVDTGKLVN